MLIYTFEKHAFWTGLLFFDRPCTLNFFRNFKDFFFRFFFKNPNQSYLIFFWNFEDFFLFFFKNPYQLPCVFFGKNIDFFLKNPYQLDTLCFFKILKIFFRFFFENPYQNNFGKHLRPVTSALRTGATTSRMVKEASWYYFDFILLDFFTPRLWGSQSKKRKMKKFNKNIFWGLNEE